MLSAQVSAAYEAPTPDAPPKLLQNIRGIIFDFDGTLFDNAKIPQRVIASYPPDLLRIRKERLVRKRFAGCDFSSPSNYYRAFFSTMGDSRWNTPEKMEKWFFNRYMPRMVRTLKKHYKPRPGAEELLRHFRQDLYKIAIYSDYPLLKERIEAIGLKISPDMPLYGPETFGAQKPAVRPLLRIAGDLGLAPEEILVVGDRNETDGYGAFHAGMRFFCIETGHKRYSRFDPYVSRMKEEPRGPSLVMYAGIWDELIKALLAKFAL